MTFSGEKRPQAAQPSRNCTCDLVLLVRNGLRVARLTVLCMSSIFIVPNSFPCELSTPRATVPILTDDEEYGLHFLKEGGDERGLYAVPRRSWVFGREEATRGINLDLTLICSKGIVLALSTFHSRAPIREVFRLCLLRPFYTSISNRRGSGRDYMGLSSSFGALSPLNPR